MKKAKGFIPTRRSLLSRLKDWNDAESWRVFFETYWKLIYNAAVQAGLTESEAEDVVQETVLSVSKSMPGFRYDTRKGSFKTWLLRLTGWRIADQFRKRDRVLDDTHAAAGSLEDIPVLERIPDPVGLKLEEHWDEEWEKALMQAAIERVRKRVDSRQYQIYDLHVVKQWPAAKVARTLNVHPGHVYLVKHRIKNLIKRELSHLQSRPV